MDQTKHRKRNGIERLIEFGKVSSGVFHDMVNPIAAISISMEQLAQSTLAFDGDARTHIDRALRASKRIETLVGLAKKHLDIHGMRRVFSPENEACDAIEILTHKARSAAVEVRLRVSQSARIEGDSVKFFQIVSNLVSNAIDSYTGLPPSPYRARSVDVTIGLESRGLVLAVADRGCGMDDFVKTSLFTPFFSTKARHEGMGLGLSHIKELVERDFDGAIQIESEPGAGSTFIVEIPRDRVRVDART